MQISENTTFIAKTFYGLENILAEEIRKIGGTDIQVLNRAVHYKGDKELLYKSNVFLRTALRILVPIKTFEAKSEDDIYWEARKIRWEDLFLTDHSFMVDSTVHSEHIKHSQFAGLRFKDAIVDRFRDRLNKRPSVNKNNPDYKINLHVSQTHCTISLDSSGESLHKRGYKTKNVKAPLNEVLAAGLIIASGWNQDSTFIDPMCGSGTLPIEATLLANDIPPGIFRPNFGFKKWREFDRPLFNRITENINYMPHKNIPVLANDISEEAMEITRTNCENAELEEAIQFSVQDFKDLQTEHYQPGTVIINPPYDVKLKKENIRDFYKEIGDTLKQKFTNFDVWVFSSNLNALKHLGLHSDKKITLYNGPLECKFNKYSIYKGSLKTKNKSLQ